MKPLERLIIWGLLTVGLCGCVHKEHLQVDSAHDEHDLMAGNEQLRIDDHQHTTIDQHQVETSGPVEQLREILGADGGVAERVTTRWGGSATEAWLQQATATDEHIELDAGVTSAKDVHDAAQVKQEEETRPAPSCVAGGYLWALALIGVAAALIGFLRKK